MLKRASEIDEIWWKTKVDKRDDNNAPFLNALV